MDVNLEMFVGGLEPSTFVRTEATEDTSPAGAFDALIAALSCVPVADVPPPPPVVWSGPPGMSAPVVTDAVVPQPAPSNGEQAAPAALTGPTADDTEDMPVVVPLQFIPGVVAMALPAVVAIEPRREGAGAQTGMPDPPAVLESMPASPVALSSPLVAPAAVPQAAAPADPQVTPPAASVVAPSQVVPQPVGSEPAEADAHTPVPPALASPAPIRYPSRPVVRAAQTAVASEPDATAGRRADVVTIQRPVPQEAPVHSGQAPLPASTPEPGGAPTPALEAPTSAVAAPVTLAPGQIVDAPLTAPAAQTGQAAVAPRPHPTTEDGQPLETRLVEVMRWQAKEGGGRVEIKLRPEYLGAMTVTLQMDGGVVKASLAAESQATRDFLQAEAGHLKTALEDHGFTLETFEIRDDREAPDDHPRQRPHQHPGSKQPGRRSGGAEAGETFDVIV